MQISAKIPVDRSTGLMRQGLLILASLKLTLVILVVLGIGVVVAYLSETRTIWALVLPLTLCALNLMAAIATNGVFRRQMPLLVFHLCLLALIVLIAVGRMTYLKGQLELTDLVRRATLVLRGRAVAPREAESGSLCQRRFQHRLRPWFAAWPDAQRRTLHWSVRPGKPDGDR